MSENPFDVGEAGKPVDTNEFDKARGEWYADRDRIVREVLPVVDAAIAETRSWAKVVDDVVILVNTLIPLLERVSEVRAVETKQASSACLEKLVGLRAALGQLGTKAGLEK